jgi:hypothetical protein
MQAFTASAQIPNKMDTFMPQAQTATLSNLSTDSLELVGVGMRTSLEDVQRIAKERGGEFTKNLS